MVQRYDWLLLLERSPHHRLKSGCPTSQEVLSAWGLGLSGIDWTTFEPYPLFCCDAGQNCPGIFCISTLLSARTDALHC
jgi:hypothetical protein